MHFDMSLPSAVENGARRTLEWDIEIVRSDGGHEVRNQRTSAPLRLWELSYNNAPEDDADHAAVEAMWIATAGGTHTFNFTDERATGELSQAVKVRFDSDLTFTNTLGPFHKIEMFVIREVRDE